MVVADGKLFVVENYLEAVGVMTALKAGVALSSVRRPLGALLFAASVLGRRWMRMQRVWVIT